MLKALRGRIDQKDEGFTLIELMVVVLIIGILMAIAIPTFLGAKGSANDRSAQENARNALTTEKEYYTNNQVYAASTVTALTSLEPSLSFQTGTPTAGGNGVGIAVATVNGTSDNVILTVLSKSGTCFYVMDEALPPASTGLAAGTYYGSNTPTAGVCTAPLTTAATAQGKAASASTWGSTW